MKVLVTGGSASGKSAFAEKIACSFVGPHIYFATMRPFGEDGRRRIARHRELRRDRDFLTVECYERYEELCLSEALGFDAPDSTLLVECVGNIVANVQFGGELSSDAFTCGAFETVLAEKVVRGILSLADQCQNIVVVTNEVGCDGIEYAPETQTYVHALGAANCRLAAEFGAVFEAAAACPLALKLPDGGLPWEP